jgi:proteic killer suppression protein
VATRRLHRARGTRRLARRCSGLTSFAAERPSCLSFENVTLDVNNALRYAVRVIRSFKDRNTEKLFRRERSRAVPAALRRVALRKLVQLDAADTLDDLKVPPGNRLERWRGDRKGQWSIRVNERWRVCFEWRQGDAQEVEIVDYH